MRLIRSITLSPLTRYSFTFSHKICAGISGTCLMLLVFITGTFFFLKQVMNEENQLISTYAEQLIFAERLQNSAKTQFSLVPVFVLTGRTELVERFEKAHGEFDSLSQNLLNDLHFEDDAEVTKLRELESTLYTRSQPGIKLKQNRASAGDVHNYFQQTNYKSEELNQALSEFVRTKTAAFEHAKQTALDDNTQIFRYIVIMTIVVLLACGGSVTILLRALQEKKLTDKKNELLFLQERRLSQARKETVEVVAHDLKNPLSTIKMSVELLLESLNHDSDGKELAKIAYRSTEFMQKLIHTLLDHAKIESGQLALDLVQCNASSFLDKIILRFKPLAKEKNIKLNTVFDAKDLRCRFDLVRMEQVFANLLDNAIKFTPEGGAVTCFAGISAKPNQAEFRITDSGPGISEEHQTLVFERFWQQRTTAKQGSGLGLAISKSIVEAHGGSITVISKIGQGTTFLVTLPLLEKETAESCQLTYAPV